MKRMLAFHCYLFILAAGWLPPNAVHAVKIQDFTYLYQCENIRKNITMHIEYDGNRVEITYFNEFGDKDITVFKDRIHPVSAVYFNPDRERIGQTIYDYKKKKIFIQGEMDAVYDLIEPVFDNNGATFYLFSVFHPEPEKTLTFRLVQSNLSRITDGFQRLLIRKLVGPVTMQLKHLGQETITLQNEEHLTVKYEFSIRDSGTSIFWSHKYLFWYSLEKNILLKHQGMSQEKKLIIYTLIEFTEWERPNPQLPSL
ncbi:hypothetical protein K8S19_01080 [bacterium]|nr:hypothetical protein [bacterium]